MLFFCAFMCQYAFIMKLTFCQQKINIFPRKGEKVTGNSILNKNKMANCQKIFAGVKIICIFVVLKINP